jgi:hypothetical protein
LTGVVIDIADLPASTTPSQLASSLQFAQWNGIAAGGFGALSGAAVPTVTIASGAGASGSSRVQIAFPDNTVQNTWLRVTVLAGLTTALTANDVFYFGNVIGEFNTGNTSNRLRVNATDTGAVRSNQSTAANSAPVTNIYDVNRDGRVNATDTGLVRSNQQTAGIVAPITIPGPLPPSAPAGFRFATPPTTGTPTPVVSTGKVGTVGLGDAAATGMEEDRDSVAMPASATSLDLASGSTSTSEKRDEVVVPSSTTSSSSKSEVDSKLQSLDEYFASIWRQL